MNNPFLPLFAELPIAADQKSKMADELLTTTMYTFIVEQAVRLPDAEKVTLLSFLKDKRPDRALLFLEKTFSAEEFKAMIEKTVTPLVEEYITTVINAV